MARVPRTGTNAGSAEQDPAEKDDRNLFQVVAFGDSLMWGQGVARDARFAHLVPAAVAPAGKQPYLFYDRSRSGAKIRGGVANRTEFAQTFVELFGGDQAKIDAFMARDLDIASDLYGEIPATFPDVNWQVSNFAAKVSLAKRRKINLAMVTGGGNDIGLDTLLDPEEFEGDFVPAWDGLIRRFAHTDTLNLLADVREACPNAVVMLFSYFAPISYASSHSKMKVFAKYRFDHDILWGLNEIFGFKDVDSILMEVRARSVWALGRAMYWQKRAVLEMNESSQRRGPGVVYVRPGFEPQNSVFGTDPWLWGDYRPDTGDDMRLKRIPEISRSSVREVTVFTLLSSVQPFEQGDGDHPDRGDRIEDVQELIDEMTGPTQLKDALRRGGGGLEAGYERVRKAATADLIRIQRAQIASFLHPNHTGSKRYRDVARARWSEWHTLSAGIAKAEQLPRQPLPANPPGAPETTGELLDRFGLRGTGSLLENIGHLDVDSFGVRVVTSSESDSNFGTDVFLVVDTVQGRRRYRLNMQYRYDPIVGIVKKFYPEFESRSSDVFMVDPGASLRLADINRVTLRLGPPPPVTLPPAQQFGFRWCPRRVILSVNSIDVSDHTYGVVILRPNDTLDLAYPPPRDPRAGGRTHR